MGSRFPLPAVLLLAAAGLALTGCGDQVRGPLPEELARFQAADGARPTVDMDRVLQAKIVTGPYRAVPGDVLRLEMPRFLEQQPVAAGTDSRQVYNCRISEEGTIVLPIIGPMAVEGKSLADIESAIAAQYYPKYVAAPLPVYASVLEYQTQRVSVVGAVAQPGIHALRHDQMSLVALLMQAGGIAERGAAVIRITRAGGQSTDVLPDNAPVSIRRLPHAQGRASGPWIQEGPSSGSPLRAVFEREGPLRTTGWLRMEDRDGHVSVREWLDIGNEPQRREFLGALTWPSEWSATEELGNKLTRLGAYLDGRPQAEESPSGWRMLDHGRFVTAAAQTPGTESEDAGARGASGPAGGTETLILPVRGLNIPFADVVLQEGDTVVVEPPREQSISIVGLVARPGNMPYPPDARYTLMEAIAYAGGLDMVANPRYVSVYRLDAEGEIVGTTFQLVHPRRGPELTEALALPLRPGDVVSVEHTPRTRTNVLLDRIFRVSLGLYVSPENLWND